MKNTRQSIERTLEESLRELAGENAPIEIVPEMVVLESWAIDSLHGVELACDLSSRLRINIPLEDNPLVVEDSITGKRRSRTFVEVVDYLFSLGSK
ncbi:MAG: hypothetical protein IAE94_15390 [Chthoniobacterales bacterium]|nr:hypothetical protein [Chthoniobacterales bacterium]